MFINSYSRRENSTPRWLSHFAASFCACDSFLQEMDRQLGKQFKDLTGFDLEAGFELRNHFPESFQIVTIDAVSAIEGDLLGKKLGYYVEISWKSARLGRNIQPNAEIDSDEVQFWWSYLDAAGIVEEETKKSELYFDTGALSFEIDNQIIVWPHLGLEITFKEKLPDNAVNYFEALLLTAQLEWNQEKEWGVIHSIGRIEFVDEQCLYIEIDFGSSVQEGLEFILHKLDETKLEITNVTIGSY
jgi:hypothetical protein